MSASGVDWGILQHPRHRLALTEARHFVVKRFGDRLVVWEALVMPGDPIPYSHVQRVLIACYGGLPPIKGHSGKWAPYGAVEEIVPLKMPLEVAPKIEAPTVVTLTDSQRHKREVLPKLERLGYPKVDRVTEDGIRLVLAITKPEVRDFYTRTFGHPRDPARKLTYTQAVRQIAAQTGRTPRQVARIFTYPPRRMGNEKISKMNPRPFADLHPIDRPQKHMTHKRAVREAMRVGYAAQYVGLTDFLKGLYKSDERDYSANVSNTRRYLHSTYSDDAKGAILAIEVQKAISDSYYRARCNGKWPADPAPRVEGKRYKSRPTKLLRRDGKNVYDLPPGTSEDVGARERQKWASASGFKQVYQPKDEATADDYETLLSDLEMGDEEISQQVSDDAQVTELGERGVAEGFTYPPDTLDVLTHRERDAFELAYLLGLTNAEVAREMGVSAQTVKTWLKRGSDKLEVKTGHRPKGRPRGAATIEKVATMEKVA